MSLRQYGEWKFNGAGMVWKDGEYVKGHIRTPSENALLAEIDRLLDAIRAYIEVEEELRGPDYVRPGEYDTLKERL